MSITVLTPGLLTTIQDNGRYGYQKYGVIVSGAMDIYSMKLANIVVGNDENEGVFEITFMGPSLKISRGNLISITGADLSPTINDKKVPLGRPIYLNEDSILKFGRGVNGCRCYLAAAGGLDIPSFMGSKSTYLRAKIGGKDGRALRKDDVIEIGNKGNISLGIIDKLKQINENGSFTSAKWYVKNPVNIDDNVTNIRVFEDRQFKDVKEESLDKFFNSSFSIDVKSDRMGYRLNGPKIQFKRSIEMISGEVSFGTIQVPPDGNPILLLADRATAGGYPKIAHVALCDIHKLVQLKPSDRVKFQKISLEEAESLYLKRQKYIDELKRSIKLISI
ncbi:biotin-dependent carboxyltransferase family protein [Clostridium tyrobutyricum]|uniref:5-oxoprolinase subunit C family protein n=1 Tax=Clostridium tyrobutyricum TaxID=1519 RepID=UPI001C388B70|nr:biotin-dependent carboxyltransferase family protein [Clostridium tyrobutyricum]MBV4421298.1 biotin-dependent carboxyltransferase family protein [Clostridium tyrobutyricum]